MISVLFAASVFLVTLGIRRPTLAVMVGHHLGDLSHVPARTSMRLGPGVGTFLLSAGVGGMFSPISPVLGAVLGGVTGLLIRAAIGRRRNASRLRRLGFELPVIADLIGLHVLTGESILAALRRVDATTRGVLSSEIHLTLEEIDQGTGLPQAMLDAAGRSAHPDAARLFELLAQAHRTGAMLIEALRMFSTDRRAAIARDLTAEGGRRALAGYGPILGLMVPTTLVFLMYPTLAGLDALAATN